MESELFFGGQRPAVNAGLSVSRVGGAAQTKAMKKLSGRLRLDLAQYRELAAFSQFGSDLDKATLDKLIQGERAFETLKQPQYKTLSVEKQVVILYALANGYLANIETKKVKEFNDAMIQFMEEKHPDVLKEIKSKKELKPELEEKLKAAIDDYLAFFNI